MAVDVIIDPSSGQIYWNDAAGSGTQTIAISGNATNAINVVGYSNFFSPGGGGLGTQILATFNDSATSTFVPGTNAYDLGSSALRWNFYGTAGNFTGVISTSSSTASTSTTTGALTVAGGLGVVGDVYVASATGSKLSVMQSSGDEGGEIFLNKAVTNTTLTTGVTIDVYQNRVRFFETGGSNRGYYLDITTGGNGVATNLAAGGSTGISSLNGLTASTQTFATGTSGTDFNISSATSTHTFNIPYAGAASTGLITTQTQTIAGAKTFSGQTIISDTTVSTTTGTGALLVYGGLGVTGQINSASLVTSGNAVINGNLQFKGNGTFGDAITDTITSLARYVSDLLPSADNTYDLGNNALGWRNFKVSGVGTIATLQVTSITSGLWSGTAITLAYGGTNNNISGIGNSYRVAIYNDSGTAITNISSAGTANSVLFQTSQSVSPIWAGQSQLVVGGASTAANIQGGALGNVLYQTGANATGFVTNAAGSGASILSQTGNAAPLFLGQSQLIVGGASTSANIQGGALGNINYQTGANATGFISNAAGSGASVLTQTGNAAPIYVGQSQLSVGSATTATNAGFAGAATTATNAGFAGAATTATTSGSAGSATTATNAGFAGAATSSALVNTDASTGTRYLVGTVLNTASGSTQLSTGSGITIGNNRLTVNDLYVANTTGSATTTSGALVVVGGVGIGGTLNVGTRNLSYTASNLLAGFAVSVNAFAQIVLQNASTGATASSDFIVNNDVSTDSTFYGSMGMNSSGYTGSGSFNLPSAVYFTSTSGDLVLGSTTANILRFVYNSGATDSMQITGTAASVLYSTASTSTTTGALTVVGGVGVGGSLWTATTNFSSISGVGHSNGVITSGVWSGTAISAVNGGTGQVSYTIGDILYASSTTALSKLSAGTAGSVLTSNGAGAAPSYKSAGSGSPAGSTSFLQYNNAGSFGATSHLAYGGNGNNDFVISSPFSGAIQGQVNIGMGITAFDAVTLGKFAGSASGTIIAVNYATGFAGNFADFQLAGSSKFTIGADGKITVVGVYSLPTTAGTAGSVLTSNGTGNQFYWTAPGSAGGGAGTVASGTANQVAIYAATGASVSGAANFTYNTTSVIITNTTASNNNSSGALLVHGGIGASGQISGAGASFTSTVFLNGIRIGQGGNNITFTDSAGTTIGDFNTSNGWLRSAQTTQSTTSGTGALVSSGGLGVAKAASIGETIYALSTVASTGWSTGGLISSGGLGVSKASYFNGDLFVTSATNSTSLSTGAVVISGGVGIGKTMFVGDNINIFKSGSVGALRLWNSANTFYTGLQAGNPSANTTYTLPITFPGTAGSTLISDTSGVMSWAAPGGTGTVTTLTAGVGISFTTGSTITTTGTVRRKTHYNLTFMSGYTPTAAGVDTVVLRVPESAADGGALIYNCRKVVLRVETPSAGTSTINVQKYASGGVTAFSTTSTGSTTNILSAALSITGATTYEASSSTFAAGHGTVAGGDKLRINFTALNATHNSFNISLLLEEQ